MDVIYADVKIAPVVIRLKFVEFLILCLNFILHFHMLWAGSSQALLKCSVRELCSLSGRKQLKTAYSISVLLGASLI